MKTAALHFLLLVFLMMRFAFQPKQDEVKPPPEYVKLREQLDEAIVSSRITKGTSR